MTAVYTGSFDPLTRGHIDIARRAAKITDKLTIAILDNPKKRPFFSLEERLVFLKQELADIPNAATDTVHGLLAAYVTEKKINVIIRGVRTAADMEYETTMARYNAMLSHGVDTVFLPAAAAFTHISCSAVKETARLVYAHSYTDDCLLSMVTPVVLTALKSRFKKGN
jgi:pantetheine-phosphate adenylyltransferase